MSPSPPAPPADRWGDRLPRRLGFWSAVAVLVGSTIGGGIFRTPAVIAERVPAPLPMFSVRSEEHTSELQSQSNLVCRLLLEKKKNEQSSNYCHSCSCA